jgi:hypothetical protein
MEKKQRRACARLLNLEPHASNIDHRVDRITHFYLPPIRPKASLTPFGKVALDISCHCPWRKRGYGLTLRG